MKWFGFPTGLRFVVKDYDLCEKRSCWDAVFACLGLNGLHESLLYDAATTSPIDPGEKQYICIICPKPIKRSRRNAGVIQNDPLLMSRLSLFEPLMQENAIMALESFQLVGMVTKNGSVAYDEGGKGLFPERVERSSQKTYTKSVLIAPDAMKNSFSQEMLCRLAAGAVAKHGSSLRPVMLPIGDGGEGTMKALVRARGGRYQAVPCHDGEMNKITANIGVLPHRIAVVESAEAVGFSRLTGRLEPARRTSYGVGELILAALRSDFSRIWVCVGGTTCSDGGVGMLAALGAAFYGADGRRLPPESVLPEEVFACDMEGLHPRLKDAEITVLCDVENPLLGAAGAVNVFGRQKGMDGEQRAAREDALLRFAAMFSELDPNAPGCGCGGGLGFALKAIGAHLVSGIEQVLDTVDFVKELSRAVAVITCEGSFDTQTVNSNKAVKAVAELSAALDKPLFIVAGRSDEVAVTWLENNCPNARLIVCNSMGEGGEAALKTVFAGIAAAVR